MSVESPVCLVQTALGGLSGSSSADGAVHSFKGLPYARAPIGPLRWRPPQPAESWTGIRDARRFGPRCIQSDRPANSISYFGPEPQSEDCLFLNIWTPSLQPATRLPVMVWLHGGGFVVGSGALPIFDGAALARRGVVVVTLNHRLGALGYLAHPALSQETPEGVSGNYGLLDQIEALRWIKSHIEAFGGDPNCVTIFGQSVGSACVNVLMTCPQARGLFNRAVGASGGSMAPIGRPGGGSMLRLEAAEAVGVKLAAGRSLAQMRALPADEINLRWQTTGEFRPFMIVDGFVVPEPIHDAFEAGHQHDVPLLTGANSDEGSARPPAASIDEFRQSLQREFGDEWHGLYAAYGSGADFARESRRLFCEKGFNWVNWTWARMHRNTARSQTYFYHFAHAPPLRPGTYAEGDSDKLGAYHTAEIPYVFGTLDRRDWICTPQDHALSEALSSYWVNFATRGDPNAAGLPEWPALDQGAQRIMRFNGDISVGALPRREILDLWDSCMQRLRR